MQGEGRRAQPGLAVPPSRERKRQNHVSEKRVAQEGEEAGTGAEAVVGIAGEVAAEHFFFVEEAKHDQRDDEEKARQRQPGAKRQRSEEQHEDSAEVHGMADEPIRSGGDDSLSFLDLNGARSEAVFLHDPKGDHITREDEELGKNGQPKRDARPAETEIQSGNRQGREENPLGPANDGLLLADLFFCAQAALDQLGIALQEINRSDRHGDEQDGHKDPGLPIPGRTSRNEKYHRNENDGDEAAQNEPGLETAWCGHRLRRYREQQRKSSR